LALKRTISHIYCQLLGQFGIVLDLAKSNNKNYNPKNQLFTVLQLFFPTPGATASQHDVAVTCLAAYWAPQNPAAAEWTARPSAP
jgi:hypothetical protein